MRASVYVCHGYNFISLGNLIVRFIAPISLPFSSPCINFERALVSRPCLFDNRPPARIRKSFRFFFLRFFRLHSPFPPRVHQVFQPRGNFLLLECPSSKSISSILFFNFNLDYAKYDHEISRNFVEILEYSSFTRAKLFRVSVF